MGSNSSSVTDKEGSGSVAGMEHEMTMSDIKEVEVGLSAGGEDKDKPKPTGTETPVAVEFVRVEKICSLMDSTSGSDKEAPNVQTERKVTMSKVKVDQDQGAGVGDKPYHEENSRADVARLVKSRQEALQLKRVTGRAAWQEEVKAELEKRAAAKRRMESTPRSQITSWKDKQIFSKISVHARKTFRFERTQFLFNEVYPIIFNRDKSLSRETFKCRLVSKVWKDAIDSFLSATSTRYHEHFRRGLPYCVKHEFSCSLVFSTLDELQSFNRKIQQEYTGLNPIPFRKLYLGSTLNIMLEGCSLKSPYWIEMGKLLERWGKEIWTATYVFENGSIELMYEYLVKYLNLMPNLRELLVIERDRSQNLGVDMLRSLGKDVLGPLKSRIERKPLPELPHLHTIVFTNFSPAPLIEAVLAKYGDTLESFNIEGPGFDNYSGEFVDLGQLVAGRELPFKKYFCEYKDATRITHWNYQFPSLNEMRLDYVNVKESPEVANIFKTVNSVGSSIRQLRLKIVFDVPEPKHDNDWRERLPAGMKLELPHLERLELMMEKTKVSDVDFLLPLVSLKELTMYYRAMNSETSPKSGKGLIQLAEYREHEHLYDSNIWKLLPEIKLVTIHTLPIRPPKIRGVTLKDGTVVEFEDVKMKTSVHTREGYRQYQHARDQKGIGRLVEHLTDLTAK